MECRNEWAATAGSDARSISIIGILITQFNESLVMEDSNFSGPWETNQVRTRSHGN